MKNSARYEISRSDGSVICIPHSAGTAAAWAECNRVDNGTYAIHMDFVAANGKRVECMDYPAARSVARND